MWRLTAAIFLAVCVQATVVSAEVEEKSFRVSMKGEGGETFRPFKGQWGPVSKAHLTKITVPKDVQADFRVLFVKPGFTTKDCGNPKAIVVVADGKTTTSDQMKDIFGVKRVPATKTIYFVACIARTPPPIGIDSFVIDITYEKELEDSAGENPPPPEPKQVVTQTVEEGLNHRIFSISCYRSGFDYGCNTSFGCPQGFALTSARAACNLETASVPDLPVNPNRIEVKQVSDDVSDGACYVGDVRIQRKSAPLSAATRTKRNILDADNIVPFGCSEHDANGGDCAINAQFACRRVDTSAERIVAFGCGVEGKNEGCRDVTNCPAGYALWDARASCHLELNSKPPLPKWGRLLVATRADGTGVNSSCWLDPTLYPELSLRSGEAPVSVRSASQIKFGCRENDKNGGDCQISGELRCVRLLEDQKVAPK